MRQAFACKKGEDFQEVLALDKLHRIAFGYSVLECAGLRLAKRTDHVRYFKDTGVGLDFLCPYYVDEEVFYWEHNYDLDKLAVRRDPEECD